MSENMLEVSQISEWYSGKCVFITGATGFIGKVLMEKLLRSCPGIKTIYILLRSKRGVAPEDRLTTLLKEPLYDILRKRNPESFKKISIIKGDVMQPDLGICPEDRAVLSQNVSVVFHSAATIKFTETIDIAVAMNVIGTKMVINLALGMKNLQAFVHLSTAFSNCNRIEIEEKLYDPPIEVYNLMQLIKLLDEDMLNKLTPILLKDWPNTYTFTKALTEQLVCAHAQTKRLPAVILRPAIVTAAWREPIHGWIDNINGPTGMMLGVAKGIVRALPIPLTYNPCLIPVDIVVNLMVSVAWHIGVNKCTSVPIFNCSTGVIIPIQQEEWNKILFKWISEYPSDSTLWYPGVICVVDALWFRIYNIFIRSVPAYIFDFVMKIMGKKTFTVKLSRKIDEMFDTYEYFVKKSWKFHSENIPRLLNTLPEADKETFNFDVRQMNWDEYIKYYHLGVKQFLLKESMDNLPKARARNKILKIVYYSTSFFILLGILLFCSYFISVICDL